MTRNRITNLMMVAIVATIFVNAGWKKPSSLTLTQTVGGTESASAVLVAGGNTDIHYHFFEVDGQAGDAFALNRAGSNAGPGGAVFEAYPLPAATPGTLIYGK